MLGFKGDRFWTAATATLSLLNVVKGIELNIDDQQSIKDAAATVAYGLMGTYYHGNVTGGTTIGRVPDPYYWWLGGAMFGSMVEYWYYTGDTSYNDVVIQGLQAQVGEYDDYQPSAVNGQLGNDDQAFWAFAVLSAAELGFPDPPSGDPGWLALAQAVFNRQVSRWDDATCNGGLRWQVFPFNSGYNYKNTVSNGGFFQLASRLYRYTRNETYLEWAEKVYDWVDGTPILEDDYRLYDGTSVTNNCIDADHHEWTYNPGMFIAGCSYLWNATEDDKWRTRLNGFIDASIVFFPYENSEGPIVVEVGCEPYKTCNHDQPSFKGFLTRWMAAATQLAPFTHDKLMPRLRASAVGAAGQCVGGADGKTCGRQWNSTTWDGIAGLGEQMSALQVIQSMMIPFRSAPVTYSTGGTSQGNPSAGTEDNDITDPYAHDPITTGDRAGAGILTAVMIVLTLGMAAFMVI